MYGPKSPILSIVADAGCQWRCEIMPVSNCSWDCACGFSQGWGIQVNSSPPSWTMRKALVFSVLFVSTFILQPNIDLKHEAITINTFIRRKERGVLWLLQNPDPDINETKLFSPRSTHTAGLQLVPRHLVLYKYTAGFLQEPCVTLPRTVVTLKASVGHGKYGITF